MKWFSTLCQLLISKIGIFILECPPYKKTPQKTQLKQKSEKPIICVLYVFDFWLPLKVMDHNAKNNNTYMHPIVDEPKPLTKTQRKQKYMAGHHKQNDNWIHRDKHYRTIQQTH